jgi:osmoprotectant transport system ATP-binding protein
MNFFEFLQQSWSELLTLTREHLFLVFVSTLVAVSIAVPLGILLTRLKSLQTPILGIANILQTVPSLALFGLLIPFPFIGGIGAKTAIIALTLYSFLPTKILDDLNLQIEKAETVVLLGESGCGKTTTLKLINRLIEPTFGEVLVEGKSTLEWNRINLRRRIGYVLQEAGLFPHFTVAENVALVPGLENWEEARKQERTAEMLELVGLEPNKFADRFPHELSGGQRQRVGVARALAAGPNILLLDEPFGALDPLTRINLQKEFAKLIKELSKTAVFVTHDLREAFVLGTRICLMDKGKIVLNDTPENFQQSDLPLARAYLETISVTKKEN